AGGELEVLRQSAAEKKSLLPVQDERVAQAVVTFLVERLPRELGLSPIPRRDVRALDARLVFLLHGYELEVHTRRRHAHVGRVVGVPRAPEGERRGLRRAEPGAEEDLLAAGTVGKLAVFVEHGLRDAGAGEPQHLHAAEEIAAQLLVLPQIRQQRLV